MWYLFQKNVVDEINTNTLYTQFPPPPNSRRLCNNVKEYDTAGQATDGKIIGRMHIAWWITKATKTPRICDTSCFPQQQRLHERGLVVRYTYLACLVLSEKKMDVTWKNKQVPGMVNESHSYILRLIP
jgi:hypothetical protein